jgi:hypothetical protein
VLAGSRDDRKIADVAVRVPREDENSPGDDAILVR